jgi:hypothetical protein
MTMLRFLSWLSAIMLSIAGAGEQPALAIAPELEDPFCALSARAVPWDANSNSPSATASSDALALAVFSQPQAAYFSAQVTLVGDVAAYEVVLSHQALIAPSSSGKWLKSSSATFVVALPKGATIRYTYVDSYSLDGGVNTTCPSEPREVEKAALSDRGLDAKSFRMDAPASGAPRMSATFLQAIPSLSCGSMYSPVTVTRVNALPYGLATAQDRTAWVLVYVDANGRVVKTAITESSELDEGDAQALLARRTTYAPATFLCVPVVGSYNFRVDFRP